MAKLSDEFLPPQTPAQVAERLYAAAADDIARSLQKALLDLGKDPERRSAQFRAARAARLLQEIRGVAERTNARAALVAVEGAQRSVQAGLVHARAQARELGVNPRRPDDQLRAGFTAIETRNVDVIARDIVARQAAAMGDFAREADFLFRTLSEGAFAGSAFASGGAGRPGALAGEVAINQAIARGLVAGDPRAIERSVREVFRDPKSEAAISFRKLGNRQVQVGGWTGSLRSYARTVALTRTREATVTARHEGLRELGVQLVQITGRVSVNFCTRFIGLVVSIGAPVDGYPSIDSLPEGGPPFHPNCSKGTAAFAPRLVSAARAAAAVEARAKFDAARANGTLLDPVRQ